MIPHLSLLLCLVQNAVKRCLQSTMVKLFDPLDCPIIQILSIMLTCRQTHGMRVVKVQMTVQTNMPKPIVSQLVKAGRYHIESGKDGDVFIIRAPHLEKAILIRDKPLVEQISIQVLTPGYFALNNGFLSKDIDEEVIAARSSNDEQARKMLMEMKKIKEKIDFQIDVTTTSSYTDSPDLSTFEIVVDGS